MQIEPLLKNNTKIAYRICSQSHPVPWSLSVFEDCLTPPYFAFQLVSGESVLGYYIALLVADEVTLMDIAVDREQRGKGIGQRLLSHCLLLAKEAGATSCWLEVRASNVSAISLYEANGFKHIETRKGYYQNKPNLLEEITREDGFVMQRTSI